MAEDNSSRISTGSPAKSTESLRPVVSILAMFFFRANPLVGQYCESTGFANQARRSLQKYQRLIDGGQIPSSPAASLKDEQGVL
ncbi:MAG: hypothetical protein KIT00_09170 [Rhodospirillales bacterium]|nr:hypothetical protein [Rhodospirillales bacterium]